MSPTETSIDAGDDEELLNALEEEDAILQGGQEEPSERIDADSITVKNFTIPKRQMHVPFPDGLLSDFRTLYKRYEVIEMHRRHLEGVKVYLRHFNYPKQFFYNVDPTFELSPQERKGWLFISHEAALKRTRFMMNLHENQMDKIFKEIRQIEAKFHNEPHKDAIIAKAIDVAKRSNYGKLKKTLHKASKAVSSAQGSLPSSHHELILWLVIKKPP